VSVTLTKQCACEGATASGPRVGLEKKVMPNGDLWVRSGFVPMACDTCDTPWTAEHQERRTPDPTRTDG
jgi:hypothetical protein